MRATLLKRRLRPGDNSTSKDPLPTPTMYSRGHGGPDDLCPGDHGDHGVPCDQPPQTMLSLSRRALTQQ